MYTMFMDRMPLLAVSLVVAWYSAGCETPASRQMSPALQHFLSSEDLDDLLDARRQLGKPTSSDARAIDAVIAEWSEEPAVSNLLIHADLIPEATRAGALHRGLDERDHPYFVLAAVVGAPNVLAGGSDALRTTFRDRLLRVVADGEAVVVSRATVSLFDFLHQDDAPVVVALLDHKDDLVRDNLLTWLLFTFDPEKSDHWRRLVEGSSLAADVKTDVRRRVADHVRAMKAGTFTSLHD